VFFRSAYPGLASGDNRHPPIYRIGGALWRPYGRGENPGSTLPRGTDSLDAVNGCCGLDARLGLGSADVAVSEADRDADDVADADRHMGERVADDAHVALARRGEAVRYVGHLWRVSVRTSLFRVDTGTVRTAGSDPVPVVFRSACAREIRAMIPRCAFVLIHDRTEPATVMTIFCRQLQPRRGCAGGVRGRDG
jgi:hypothetical protein